LVPCAGRSFARGYSLRRADGAARWFTCQRLGWTSWAHKPMLKESPPQSERRPPRLGLVKPLGLHPIKWLLRLLHCRIGHARPLLFRGNGVSGSEK
jgi:hypothetical protein